LYSNIQETNLPFEIVFVGPNAPDFILPKNFKFIQTNVKPVQCVEIAARAAKGKYLVPTADDCFFDIQNPLTKLYNSFLLYENSKLILSCKYFTEESGRHIHAGILVNKVYLPVGFMIEKDYWLQLGGLDRNFIALYWDLDLCFRIVVDGGITALSDVQIIEKFYKEADTGTSLFAEYYPEDKNTTLQRLWPMFCYNNQFKRTAPLEPFTDFDILTESQGPKGRW
jgi:hypothetical protein